MQFLVSEQLKCIIILKINLYVLYIFKFTILNLNLN